jgi:hypothetical protein
MQGALESGNRAAREVNDAHRTTPKAFANLSLG